MILQNTIQSALEAASLLGLPLDGEALRHMRTGKGWEICLKYKDRYWHVGDEVSASDRVTQLEGADLL